MNFKFKKVVYSFFGFLIVLTIADKIDEYLLRQELKKKYSKKYSLGTQNSEHKCFDIKPRDYLYHTIDIEGGFAKFCINKKYLDVLDIYESDDKTIYDESDDNINNIQVDLNWISIPMKDNWIMDTFYVKDLVDENGASRFAVPTADPKKRFYLKEKYR